jgi:soluble lytic murein transglycosylase-like protein/rubrerythrin
MRSVIDFAELDLRGALDFAILIEEDAQLRYERLARVLGDDACGAGAVFRMMIGTEARHRRDLVARRTALFGTGPARIEISVMDEGVEGPDVDDDELPRSAREALAMSAAAERRAYEFYEAALPSLRDPAARAFFEGLMAEELEHEDVLLKELAELEARAPIAMAPPAPRPAPRPRESFPDREALEAALPGFDAATRAVATSVIVRGMDEDEVAAALGVSRRSVSRKLTRFLGIARQRVAIAAAAATLAGCAGNLRGAESELRGAVLPDSHQVAVAAVGAVAAHVHGEKVEREDRSPVARRIRAEVARRMPGYDSSMHVRVARAVLDESRAARLDPLLVLAVIHVESSFDPDAFSQAGAVGLMQLLEPTLQDELKRAGLAAADPSDPVANVQAGVRYLRRLVRIFGALDVALMAYNAGPNRILGHLRNGEIPERFHEYPKRVNEELSRLRSVFAEPAAATGGAPPVGDGAA